MTETILHTCTVSWGMTIGDSSKWINEMIENKKKDVEEALNRAGFNVKSQHFIDECEWGTLYTWAELIDDPENTTVIHGEKTLKFGKFYK